MPDDSVRTWLGKLLTGPGGVVPNTAGAAVGTGIDALSRPADIWKALRQRVLPGIGHTIGNFTNTPGMVVGGVESLLNGVMPMAADIAQDLPLLNPTGGQWPGATKPAVNPSAEPLGVIDPYTLGKQFHSIANTIARGVGLDPETTSAIMDSYDKPRNATDVAINTTKLAWDRLTNLLPFSELGRLVAGVDESGNPSTPEKTGSDLLSGLLKTQAVVGPVGGALSRAKVNNLTADIEARAGQLKIPNAQLKAEGYLSLPQIEAGRTTAQLGDHPISAQDIAMSVAEMWKSPGVHQIATDIAASEIAQQTFLNRILKGKVKKGKVEIQPPHEFMVDMMDKGIITPERMVEIAKATNSLVTPTVEGGMAALDVAANQAGRINQILADFQRTMLDDVEYSARVGNNPAAQAVLAKIRKANTITLDDVLKGDSNWYSWVLQRSKSFEQIRRGLGVSAPSTAFRNYLSQGLQYGLSAMEDGIASAVSQMAGGKPWDQSIGQGGGLMLHNLYSFAKHLDPRSKKTLYDQAKSIIDLYPKLRRSLSDIQDYGGLEAGEAVMNNYMKSKLGEGAHAAVDWVNGLNRLQERQWRIMNFASRLEDNFKALGVDDLTQAREKLLQAHADRYTTQASTAVDGLMHQALADAEIHALKNTFSYTPAGGFAKGFLDFLGDVPFSTMVLPFPRFLVNTYRWMTEHNPGQLMAFYSPEFRAMLKDPSQAGIFKTRAGAQMVAKATTGALMFSAAWALRNSEAAGPKYYELDARLVGDPQDPQRKFQGRGYIDARPYNPFSMWLGIADFAKKTMEGKDIGLSANEWLDFWTNIRRVSDNPALSFDVGLKNMTSDDPELQRRWFVKVLGQQFGMFARPFQVIEPALQVADQVVQKLPLEIPGIQQMRDLGDLFSKRAGKTADIQDNELLGPIEQALPGKPNIIKSIQQGQFVGMPLKEELYSGQPREIASPIRQIAGINTYDKTPLQAFAETHGLNINELVPDYGNPEANRLIQHYIGKILASPAGKSKETLGTKIALSLNNLDKDKLVKQAEADGDPLEVLKLRSASPDDLKAYQLKEIFKEIRNEVYDFVSNDPDSAKYFLEYKLKNSQELGPGRQNILNELRSKVQNKYGF